MNIFQLADGRSLLVSTQLCGLQAGGFGKPSCAVCCCLGCSEHLLWVVRAGGSIEEVFRKRQLRKQCGGSSEGVSAFSVKKIFWKVVVLIQISARRETRQPKQQVTGFSVLGWRLGPSNRWTSQRQAQVGRKSHKSRSGQGAHPPLWSALPVCLIWGQTSGCDLSPACTLGLQLWLFQVLEPRGCQHGQS